MRRAIALSLENVKSGGGPFGCVIAKSGDIIAEGVNTVVPTNDPTAHAEVVAIRNACRALANFQLSGCELYSSCEPCPMCLAAIYWARPERVYFGNTKEDAAQVGFDDSLIYAEVGLPIPSRRIPMLRLLGDEALAAFRAWEKSESKVRY
jgi:guanine deaminase